MTRSLEEMERTNRELADLRLASDGPAELHDDDRRAMDDDRRDGYRIEDHESDDATGAR